MNKKQLLWGLLFAVGLSGIYGIIGCALILIAYAGMNWEKLQSKDQHTRKILVLLSSILGIIIVLDIAEMILG